jgi:hypothetical protein
MEKKYKLTESGLNKLVNKILNEQNTQQVYNDIANSIQAKMSGLNFGKDAKDIEEILLYRIKNMNDWEGLKKAFGKRDGKNLEEWITGEWRLDLKKILKGVRDNDTKYRQEDSQYNPGSKIRLITNRQFIQARAYQYASIMRASGKRELEVDIKNATVVKRDKDAIVVKASYVNYYSVSDYKRGEEYPKSETLSNVCIRIKFSDIIEWRGDSLQVEWLSNFVKSYVVTC